MSMARRITEADRYVRGGKWKIAWSPTMLVGGAVYGKTLGVIGIGNIGMIVAEKAVALGMKVMAYDLFVGRDVAEAKGIELVTLCITILWFLWLRSSIPPLK
jgi:phosphoglycerate dehydrogenase-like enzyme